MNNKMRKQIILSSLWVVLLVNATIFWLFYIFSKNFAFLNTHSGSKNPQIETLQDKTVVKQQITQTYDISDIQSKIMWTVKEIWNSVVNIIISKDLTSYYYTDPFSFQTHVEKRLEKVWWGSWIIIAKNWYILTNKHVVEDLDADYSVLTKNWDVYKVNKIWTDPVLDIAIIKVVWENWQEVYDLQEAKIIWFNSKITVWQFVLAIWNALWEYDNTVTLWILSAKWRQLNESNGSLYIWMYQTDTAINRGNSWWPLINIAGEVIWINTAITAVWQWIGFTIPINKEFINASLKSIQEKWKIQRPMIWVQVVHLNKTIAKKFKLSSHKWALVQKIVANSPAFKAWLKKWDIILKINDIEINNDRPIIYTLFIHNIWDKLNLLIDRKGTLMKKEITLSKF